MQNTVYQKGYRFLNILKWLESEHGAEAVEAVRSVSNQDMQQLISYRPLPSAKLAYGTNQQLLQSICDLYYEGDIERITEITRAVTYLDVRSVIKFVLVWTSPKMLFRSAEYMYGLYTNGGELNFEKIDDNTGKLTLISDIPMDSVKAHDFIGSVLGFLDMSSATNVGYRDTTINTNSITVVFTYSMS